jgi:flavin-dependent dehydrogenase
VGQNRISAGDAAISFDPLCAHWISLALVSGVYAATAIVNQINGDKSAFDRCGQLLEDTYSHYSKERLKHYQSEQRWKANLFGSRRHPEK